MVCCLPASRTMMPPGSDGGSRHSWEQDDADPFRAAARNLSAPLRSGVEAYRIARQLVTDVSGLASTVQEGVSLSWLRQAPMLRAAAFLAVVFALPRTTLPTSRTQLLGNRSCSRSSQPRGVAGLRRRSLSVGRAMQATRAERRTSPRHGQVTHHRVCVPSAQRVGSASAPTWVSSCAGRRASRPAGAASMATARSG